MVLPGEDLPDVQNTESTHKVPLWVGISGMKIPLRVKCMEGDYQSTIATTDMQVELPEHLRGANMSRLPIILSEMDEGDWVLHKLNSVLDTMISRLQTSRARIRLEFPYFLVQKAPVTGHSAKRHVNVAFDASRYTELRSPTYQYKLTVTVPVITLCPCSKEISEHSAHNQRAYVTMTVEYDELVWIEELVKIAEESSSSPVYPVLKRLDEKFVTEHSYAKPRFVEDVAREVFARLGADVRVQTARVMVRSEESIHQHDAVAEANFSRHVNESSWKLG